MSRTSNVIKNTFYGVIGKFIGLGLSFISRTVFINYLGSTYLGVNGLYSEILSMLSFAELGFGSALIFSMYGPVARGEQEKTLQLLDFYKKTYRWIACTVAIIGISLLPFLQYIVKGTTDNITLFELRLYYVIFLFNSVVSYFVTYKYSYVNVLQKNRIITNFNTTVNFVSVIVQIIIIWTTRSFLWYLLAHCFVLLLSKVVVSIYLNNKFPILTQKPSAPLDKSDQKNIFREVKGLALHQFAGIAVHSTDNLIIAAITNLGIVGVALISNYTLIINNVTGFITVFFSQFAVGFGNLATENNPERYREVFRESYFLSFWIYGFSSIAFYILIPPFITLWLGQEYLIDNLSLLLIVTNCFLQGQYLGYHYARTAKGNFKRDQWLAFIQAIVNLVVSIIAARFMGLAGVYVGTVVSRLVAVIARPLSTYRFVFGRSPWEYYVYLLTYGGTALLAGIITWLLTKNILAYNSFISLFAAAVIVLIIPNLIFFLLFFRTKEFQSLLARVKSIIRR